SEAINKLVAARLAADVLGVPTVIIARTDADAADLLLTDHDPRDARFLTGRRSSEGFFYVKAGIEQAIDRGLAYAPYADLLWCETSKPDMAEAKRFAAAIHAKFPGKLLAFVQLAGQARRGRDEALARGSRGHGLPLPIHHAGRLARAESVDVRIGHGIPCGRHVRLFAVATARVRPGSRGLPGRQAPVLRRY